MKIASLAVSLLVTATASAGDGGFATTFPKEQSTLPKLRRGPDVATPPRAQSFLTGHSLSDPDPSYIGPKKMQAMAQRQLAGMEGMVKFKEKIGRLWVYETRVGYAGTPGPITAVVEPTLEIPNFDKTPAELISER